jgi:DNA-binding XRE family transcriptional regulator
MTKQEIFKQLKQRRKDLRINQVDLCKSIDINESTLIRNYKGDTNMSLDTFISLCTELKIKINLEY